MVANYSLKQVIKDAGTQAGVWDEVNSANESVAAGVAARSVRSELSPSSLPLALENEAVQESSAPYLNNLSSLPDHWHDVIGVAFAINDQIIGADVYSSNLMFKRLWPRLLKAAAIEAIATPAIKRAPNALPIATVGEFLVHSELGAEVVRVVNTRTRSVERSTQEALFIESRDTGNADAWIHRSYLPRKQ
jgi:hypothetical protein